MTVPGPPAPAQPYTLTQLRLQLIRRLLVPLAAWLLVASVLAAWAGPGLSRGAGRGLQDLGLSGWLVLVLLDLLVLVLMALTTWRVVGQALQPLLDRVASQGEHQRRFVADAAHQLRTPLAALQSQVEAWAQAARRIVPPGASGSLLVPVDQVEKLCGATRRTTQLANQLLALSRAEARGMTDRPAEAVDLRALSEEVLEAYLGKALARHIDLGLAVEPVQVPGHAWLLREFLANIVDNAIKYTPVGGTVTIRGGPGDGAWVAPAAAAWGGAVSASPPGVAAFLAVEDDGPGVSDADLPRILDRFYRVPGAPAEGTGLGLAIADEIARVHGARLGLTAGEAGQGLRVTLLFPALSRV